MQTRSSATLTSSTSGFSASTELALPDPAPDPPTTFALLADTSNQYTVTDPGAPTTTRLVDDRTPPVGRIWDARGLDASVTATYMAIIGDNEAEATTDLNQAWIGGKLSTARDTDLTHRNWKDNYDGTGLLFGSPGYVVVEGLRLYNVQDGIRPRGGGAGATQNFRISNCWFRLVHDDAIENDHHYSPGVIEDCLFERVFTFYSQQQEGYTTAWNGVDRVTIRRCLAKLGMIPLQRSGQPGDENPIDANGDGHGRFFKFSGPVLGSTTRNALPVDVSDCIFWAQQIGTDGESSMVLPAEGYPAHGGCTYSNVTLIWTGDGDYPGPIPKGVTVTDDTTIWDDAVDAWCAAHGVTDYDAMEADDTQMIDPDPWW